MSALLELAERCEQATGPDRELDVAVHLAADMFVVGEGPHYTASLDAAMTLVPEGHEFGVGNSGNPDGGGIWAWCEKETKGIGFPYARGATLALALCAASLRAIAAQEAGQ